MTALRRDGFSLIELLMALVVMAIVGNAILAMVIAMQRITRQQSEVAALQGSLRTGLQLLQAELLELAPEDLTDLSDRQLGYRAMRGIGETCELGTTELKLRKATYAGLRPPTYGRDGLWLFLDGDSTRTTDDRWIVLDLGGVAASACPDGEEAWSLGISLAPEDLARGWVPGPIRTFEQMEIGQVQADGQEWLGIRSIGFGEESLVPVTGPVPWNGVRFRYLDQDDALTGNPLAVTSILITLRGVTERPVGIGNGGVIAPTDSLTLRIRLRN